MTNPGGQGDRSTDAPSPPVPLSSVISVDEGWQAGAVAAHGVLEGLTQEALARMGCATAAEALARLQEVVAVAEAWHRGEASLVQADALCEPYERFVAMRRLPAARPVLLALVDALIDRDGNRRTRHGTFTREECEATEAKIEREGGEERLIFPVRYPWLVKPDANRGVEGIRAHAVYRQPSEREAQVRSFRVTIDPADQGRGPGPGEPDFWDPRWAEALASPKEGQP